MNTVKTGLRAGGLNSVNHGLKVRSTVRAGGLTATNHSVKARPVI